MVLLTAVGYHHSYLTTNQPVVAPSANNPVLSDVTPSLAFIVQWLAED
jgi:hypothetical protein